MQKTELELLKQETLNCYKCADLVTNRTQVVFGHGNHCADIMFIGEAPGQDEDKKGEPFVGRAGRLLTNIIKACGWKRENVFISNTCLCRPPSNRTPKEEECNNCRNFLFKQIELVNPKYIVCLGSVATANILGLSLDEARGKLHYYKDKKVISTYHPAALLRDESKKKKCWEDLQLLLKEINDRVYKR